MPGLIEDANPELEDELYRQRHTLAHLLASAVQTMFPEVKLGFGPPVDNGFYYDFLTEEPFSETQLKKIQKKMMKLAGRNMPMEYSSLSIEEALKLFEEKGEVLKVEHITELAAQGETEVGIYTMGDFVDLCKGPHVEKTRKVPMKGFRLDRVAGAYWRGDEKNPMLSRIYGLAFPDRDQLNAYIHQREEAEKRDHRRLNKALDLFVIDPVVGKGLPMLTERGTTLRRTLERFIIDEEIRRGYKHVQTPVLGRKHLYEVSGHWDHYQDSMYPPVDVDGEEYCLRPMTCPHHFRLYASRPHSYRELPLRIGEVSPMYRKEKSGELTGLIRVMGFHLADAHIFIEPHQVKEVFVEVIELIQYVMDCLGLTERCWYRVSLKDDKKEKYIDNPQGWADSEKVLLEIAEEMGLNYTVGEGDAAFYGPKLDVQMKTVGGRDETLFTNQIDLAMAGRFELEYIAQDGSKQRPWIVHRSSIGCMERTIAFLTEHYAGAFPTWLAPVQAKILPITDEHIAYSTEVAAELEAAGCRVEIDDRNESLNKKVRESKLQKIPYLLVIGSNEIEEQAVMVTNRDNNRKEKVPTAEFVKRLAAENKERSTVLGCAAAE